MKYRISRYDPAAPFRDEWSSLTDAGDNITLQEYLRWEAAYLQALDILLAQETADTVTVSQLELHPEWTEETARNALSEVVWTLYREDYKSPVYRALRNGETAFLRTALHELVRIQLREEAWFVLHIGETAVDAGYDFYLHIETETALSAYIPLLPQGIYLERR